jgi:hypothetical protein
LYVEHSASDSPEAFGHTRTCSVTHEQTSSSWRRIVGPPWLIPLLGAGEAAAASNLPIGDGAPQGGASQWWESGAMKAPV